MTFGLRARWMWVRDIDTDLCGRDWLLGVGVSVARAIPAHPVNLDTPWTVDSPLKTVVQAWVGFLLFYVRVDVTWPVKSDPEPGLGPGDDETLE